VYNGRSARDVSQGGVEMLDRLAKILTTLAVLFILAGILYFAVFR
jgi:lysophospholipase L1-like esterase